VAELHVHPDAEELVIVTRGRGQAIVGNERLDVQTGDVVYVPPAVEHELRNTGDELLGVLFINVPVDAGLERLLASQRQTR
jgi:mannose-6-phosphate isomerase-like protein (cupin superfamily)